MNHETSPSSATEPPLAGAPLVQIVDLHKTFGRLEVLRGITMEVQRGEVVCVLGRSGSGKSTLLRCINHLERPTQGTVLLDGETIGYRLRNNALHELHPRQVAKQRTRVGMVFQSFNLFPHLSVLANLIEAPTRVLGRPRDAVTAEALIALKEIGLADKADSYPDSLSGGQQQRAAIARALLMQPDVLLFDEPTSALDPELVGEVLDVLRRLAASGMTMIVVTHEVRFAANVADRIVFMHNGRIVEQGSPAQIIGSPKQPETQDFFRNFTNGDLPANNIEEDPR